MSDLERQQIIKTETTRGQVIEPRDLTINWIVNHYGTHFDSRKPTTGVWSYSTLTWIDDDLHDAIDPDYEDEVRAYQAGHDGADPPDGHFDNWEAVTRLIGFKWDAQRKIYVIDKRNPKVDYAAICREDVVQIIWSRYVTRSALCSPCYPGQCDGETRGQYLCFAPPPDLIGSVDAGDITEEQRNIIKRIRRRK